MYFDSPSVLFWSPRRPEFIACYCLVQVTTTKEMAGVTTITTIIMAETKAMTTITIIIKVMEIMITTIIMDKDGEITTTTKDMETTETVFKFYFVVHF